MAISFKESKELAAEAQVPMRARAMTMTADVEATTYAAGDAYQRCEKYLWYDSYRDDKYSVIDSLKNVTVDPSQINLTQEANSQLIPFEMPRYYDGVDLIDMAIQVHFVNKEGYEDYAAPINVEYNADKIRFGWLVGSSATYLAGDLQFEILATGVNEKGDNYIWKSRPNGKINILKSLAGNGVIEPSNDWYTQFIIEMDSKISQAMTYAQQAQQAANNAQDAVDGVQGAVDSAVEALRDEFGDSFANYYTKTEADSLHKELEKQLGNIDGLANFRVEYNTAAGTLKFYNGTQEIASVPLNSDPSDEWTAAYDKKVEDKVQGALSPVEQKIEGIETTTKNALDAMSSALEEKADKTAVESLQNRLGIAESNTSAIQTSVDELSGDITGLREKVEGITTSPSNEYEATYEDNVFTLLENGSVKNQFTIVGGSGGGAESSVITISRVTDASITVVGGERVEIQYNFSSVDNAGDETGDGTAVWFVGNTKVATTTVAQGLNNFDVTAYLNTGNNTVKVQITDSMNSVATKNWTVNLVEFYLDSSFDDSLFYSGDVVFRYTPYGSVEKTIYFELDGNGIGSSTTSLTGRQMSYTLPAQAHGAHLLNAYMTAVINGKTVRCEAVQKDIMWIDENESTPVISCPQRSFAVKQYNSAAIAYTVYDPGHTQASVELWVDGQKMQTVAVPRTRQTWSFKSADVGSHTLRIVCGATEVAISCVVEDLGIEIAPVTTNLALDFNPSGKSNADLDNRLWTDGSTAMEVSENFDWVNGGYQLDEEGDTCFLVKAGTSATFNYKLFADDAKRTGKNFKFIYKTANVRNYDAAVLQCENGGIGFAVNAQNAVLHSQQNTVEVPFCEGSYMELELNILPDAQHKEMVLWIDGIPCRVALYPASDTFTQNAPVGITIGSDDCDVMVYRMKAYTMNLTDEEILDNRIADAKNAEEMMARYLRNQIVNAGGEVDPDLVAEVCPDLRVIKISAPRLTAGKKNEIGDTTVQQIYKHGRSADNWTATGSHKGQGTSSDNYGESARNIDIDLSGGFQFADGSTAEKYAMTENSVPESYFNIKVNVASSENANNAVLADDYNMFNPYLRAARAADSRVRDTMEFHPCVIFVQETDIANSTVFHDGQYHFYACGDFGNSKKNKNAMGMDPDNHQEFIVEIANNTSDQGRWLSDDLSSESWDGNANFEFRYANGACSEEELQAGKDAWQRLLSWVVSATPETFAAQFDDYFVKDSLLFFYLFTERHTMVDNRAKNTFWHTEDLQHWDVCFDYDNDTADGNDNEGGLTLTYGYEDSDMIGTKAVFNAHDSKLWCYIRDYFADELAAMYIRLEGQLAWSADRILKKFEDYQGVKPERLWVADMRRKYFRTYEENGTTSYLPMMHGDKKHQRRQFERYQEKYIASKYVGSACTADVMTIRGYTPANWAGVRPDGTLTITPYADIYVVCRYGSYVVKQRAKRGQTYTVESPIAAMNDTEVYVYSASLMQDIGSIAAFYPGYVDFAQGVKLTSLQVGSGTAGYSNTNLTDFDIGNNVLLEYLDLRNVPNLNKSISLRACANLAEFYAEGSGITGVEFADGGKIAAAHLPEIASLTAKNLQYLADLEIAGYDNLTTLVVENCDCFDLLALLNAAGNLNRVRLIGIDWQLEDTALLERLRVMAGVDENGYAVQSAVLSGKVHVPVMREQMLHSYNQLWPDLEISYNTLIEQYVWTFVNSDGTVLDVQYVDKGSSAVDPVTRTDKPIATPTVPSTVSTDFTFAGWDTALSTAFANQTVMAVYTESPREYTIRYLNRGHVLKTVTAPYGSTVLYDGETPQYTAEETAYKFYLFTGWSESGYVTGDKDIEAVYDICSYTAGYFDGKELASLRPVEIYAMIRTGNETSCAEIKDSVTLTLGSDFDFSDIEQKVLVDSKIVFDGANHLDTQEALFAEDRSFVLALDYKLDTQNAANSVLAQCYEANGMNGFRLWYNSGAKFTWGTASETAALGAREMAVLRHVRGENGLHVYFTNRNATEQRYVELARTKGTATQATLVLGCSKADDGAYENHAVGCVYWAKVWYADLGEEACRQLAAWPREERTFEMCGFKRYYLSDNASKRCSMTFLDTKLMDGRMALSNVSANTGGWAAYTLNSFLNTRLIEAMPIQWKQLIQKVKISSSVGGTSGEISTSDCWIAVPAASEVNPNVTSEPYCYEGTAIPYFTTNASRIGRTENGDAGPYWTRSPNASYSSYCYVVTENGDLSAYYYPYDTAYVRMMFSI